MKNTQIQKLAEICDSRMNCIVKPQELRRKSSSRFDKLVIGVAMVAEAAGWPDTMRQIRGSIDWWMAELEPHGMIDWYKPESTKTPFSLFVDMYQHGYMDRIDKEGGRVEYQLTPQGFKCGNCRYTLHQIYA